MNLTNLGIVLACILIIMILSKFAIWPIRKLCKLIINSILGGVIIFLINQFGLVHIGLNIITCACVGILGVPGLVLIAFV